MFGLRERQKRDRRERIFRAAMSLFEQRGFEATTILAIAKLARVSRGTVFNYYPYKEAILLEHLGTQLLRLEQHLRRAPVATPLAAIRRLFAALADFAHANQHLVLPLSYELLNPDPARSKAAYSALPLAAILQGYLGEARAQDLIRRDFSLERLSRSLANTFFLTCLQWAAYRLDRSLPDELDVALTLALEGMREAGVGGRELEREGQESGSRSR